MKAAADGSTMTRINRYIMECKLAMIVVVIITDRELIDTLWNVNFLVA